MGGAEPSLGDAAQTGPGDQERPPHEARISSPRQYYPGGHNEGFPDSFKQLYRAIYNDVAAGKRSAQPLYATFEDGHRELLLCDAILKSHQAGQWVEVGG